ncbi:MAG: universal stress protein [Cohaesibacteraceae bacterium]
MYKNILIPVALDHETLIAPKLAKAREMLAPGGRITLLTVLESIPGFVAEFVTVKSENHLSDAIRKKLEAVAEGADDVDCEVTNGKPGLEIVNFAKANGHDLILIGSQAPGAVDYALGSTTSRVVRRSTCSVLVLR